jgi:hypothetical protein
MADAPAPITAPPAPDGPYDATAPGAGDAQSDTAHVYDAAGGSAKADPWPKIQEGGAADWRTGQVTGGWPDDGTSDGSKWNQV